MGSPNCVVVGIGPGNGAAFARAFAREGYRVGLIARSRATLDPLAAELAGSIAITCDVRVPEEIERTFARLRDALGPVDVLIYNAGAGAFEDIDQATPESLESAWRTNALGLFVATRAVLPDMRAQRRGSIVVVGATASLRGGAKFLPFAAAKAAQRSIAQSMARKLWPEGIHVGCLHSCASPHRPGRSSSICGPSWRSGDRALRRHAHEAALPNSFAIRPQSPGVRPRSRHR